MSREDLMGGYVEFEGRLCKVIGHNRGQFDYLLEEVEPRACPNCDHTLGKYQFEVIESSLLWQQGAKPVKTLTKEGI